MINTMLDRVKLHGGEEGGIYNSVLTIPISEAFLRPKFSFSFSSLFFFFFFLPPSFRSVERPKSPRKSLNMQLKEILGYCALL